MKTKAFVLLGAIALGSSLQASEFHVAVSGKDASPGTQVAPLRTIQRAADLAQPGDVITVHEGVYRERINPPRGGESDVRRIVYQAAPGEKVAVKGSEVVKGWVRVQEDVWKATLPNSFFGSFNPYSDLIRGDWFNAKGREHHTGAVYLNGDWLAEAAKKDDVQAAAGATSGKPGTYLVNMAWFSAANGGVRVSADSFAEKSGMNTAPSSEGGRCLGWIEDSHWARYENVDFGSGAMRVEIRAASCTGGGAIELRLDKPDGVLLGTCQVADTGDWQAWRSFDATIKPTSGKRTICLVFRSTRRLPPLWFAEVGQDATTIWAQFKNADPNKELVEINVRRTVFYPDKPGRNYITVRGFTMCHAATPWAPPTAEQIGLIGTHWSKGWVIEDNVISHSICSGISLGKHGDEFDNTSANSAEGYVKTIERAYAHAFAWTKDNIGHHIVRSNTVSHCEQAGIVGSLGCSFSSVTGNVIHDIHVRRLFAGAEMAGIKFHGAIDTQIVGNRIYRTCRGLWLDWMAQGTRVSRNLFYDNADQDLFVEVNHGPFLVDNNLFLSGTSLLDVSEGGAYVHNVIAGRIVAHPELKRDTPFHPAHATALAGLVNTKGGDNRFYNNILIGRGDSSASTVKPPSRNSQHNAYGLWVYDSRELPLQTGGNIYYNGACPYAREENRIEQTGFDPRVSVAEEGDHVYLQWALDQSVKKSDTRLVNTERMGKAIIPQLSYENADGSPVCVNTDYFGMRRNEVKPTPGPFEDVGTGDIKLRVW
jgi:hypothetical protein